MGNSSKYKRSENTATKQLNLARLLKTHIKITSSILSKGWAMPQYLYFDLNAGCGRDTDTGEPGSPLVFLDTIKNYSINYKAYFFEVDDQTRDTLTANLSSYKEQGFKFVIGKDHNEIIKELPIATIKWQYGLVYSDPSNAYIPTDLLKYFNDVYPQIDAVINLACASQKRASRSLHTATLKDMLASIKKKEWIFSKPVSKFQWSMMLGTNWGAYPKFEQWFYKSSSPDGEHILELLSSTKEEIREKNQPTLL